MAYIVALIVVCLLVGLGELLYRMFFPEPWRNDDAE